MMVEQSTRDLLPQPDRHAAAAVCYAGVVGPPPAAHDTGKGATMNDREMREHVDSVLAELEQRLQRRRRSKLAMAGSAAGLALAIEGCFKMMYGITPEYAAPVYGVEVDAGDAGVTDAKGSDAINQDVVVLYGVPDGAGFEAAVRYGIQCDAGTEDAISDEGVVRYGIGC
jgi:hypothetical protein